MNAELSWRDLHKDVAEFPHQLFMLNSYGQTPLDIAIQDTVSIETC
jgi:hypothetical protein